MAGIDLYTHEDYEPADINADDIAGLDGTPAPEYLTNGDENNTSYISMHDLQNNGEIITNEFVAGKIDEARNKNEIDKEQYAILSRYLNDPHHTTDFIMKTLERFKAYNSLKSES